MGNLTAFSKQKRGWDQNIPLPDSLIHVRRTVDRSDDSSMFCTWNSSQKSTVNNYIVAALDSIISGDQARVSIVEVNRGCQYAAERTSSKGDTVVVVGNENGNFLGAQISPDGSYHPLCISNETDLAPMFAVVLMLACESEIITESDVRIIARKCLEDFKDDPKNNADRCAHYLSDIISIGMRTGKIKGNVSPEGNFRMLEKQIVKNGAYSGTVICGLAPNIVSGGTVVGGRKTVLAKEARRMFKNYAEQQTWPAEAEKYIPSFPDDFPVMPEVLKIASRFVNSRGTRLPFNNVLWRGITSYGKSTGVEMIAYLLHTPLLRMTCSSGMDAQDFLSQYIPDSGGSDEPADPGTASIPSFMEIVNDPESAWETLTGKYEVGVTGEQVFFKMMSMASSGKTVSNARYKLVESNYVTALKNGWICEIQEMSRIKDPGVMVTLNEYDRPGARIPLANGESAVRAENAMVIYTDNVGYTSCRDIDPSVMRRMDYVLDSRSFSDDMIIERVRYNTGFDDDDRLQNMLEVFHAVKDFCKENDITYGDLSVNEIERWANIICQEGIASYEEACRECLIAKASPDEDDQTAIWEEAARLHIKY